MQQVPASKQVDQLREQLAAAFVEREDAQSAVKSAEEKIKAIRNVLAGIVLGQKLQQEIDAAEREAQQGPPQPQQDQ